MELSGACAGCARVDPRAAERHPLFVARLEETTVFLHDHQPLAGWTVLYLNEHGEHMADLSAARQARVLAEVCRAARAVRAATGCRRINYECLGNVLAHVHWHVIPRYLEPVDPEPRRTVWTRPEGWLNCGAGNTYDNLVLKLRGEIGK